MVKKKSGESNKAKVAVVSELPFAGILGNSEGAKEAWQGILEYARLEQPTIFFDGGISSIQYPGMFVDEVRHQDTLEEKLNAAIDIVAERLHELYEASPTSQIYVARTDEDHYNVGQLREKGLKEKKKKHEGEGLALEAAMEGIRAEMDEAKEKGEIVKWKSLRGQLGNKGKELKKLEKKGAYKKPEKGSPEWEEAQENASQDYYGRLQEMCPSNVHVAEADSIEVNVNGVLIQYAHNGHTEKSVLSDRCSKLLGSAKGIVTSSDEVPSLILEGGHHGESTTQFIRHVDDKNDAVHKYTLVGSGMVMEDQELAAEIADGAHDERIGREWKNSEAMKRFTKKGPAAGIMIWEVDGEGHFPEHPIDLDHLRRVGRGELAPGEIEWDTLYLISDLHVGKFTTNYDIIRKVMQVVEDHVDMCLKEDAPFPVLLFLNEMYQGFNYKTMPVEQSAELRRELSERIDKELARMEAAGLDQVEGMKKLWLRDNENKTLCRLEDQVRKGSNLVNRTLTWLLMNTDRDIGLAVYEANHVAHTVGEKGITECFFLTHFIEELDRYTEFLVEKKILPPGEVDEMYSKVRKFEEGIISGFGTINLESGDLTHKIVAEHKPGSGGVNALKSHEKRLNNMAVSYDLSIAGHQHQAAGSRISKWLNRMANIIKAATVSAHDSYGKRGGFPAPTEGYVTVKLPRTKGAEGTIITEYKFGGALYEDL